MQDELSLTGTFKKPKDLKSSMIFTDVNMKYYPTERIYRSEGQFGLSFIGDKGIHKRINGYLEFGHRMGSDYMNIYLKTEYNDFVYITYATTLMEVASSFRDIIEKINMIKHLIKNIIQHYETLKQFQNRQHEYEEYLEWFKTLPLYYETDQFKAVHACWDKNNMCL